MMMIKIHRLLILSVSAVSLAAVLPVQVVAGFVMPVSAKYRDASSTSSKSLAVRSSSSSSDAAVTVCAPSERQATYGSNVAQYLVDLHNAKATFDFCGGMMFQLVLTDKLRDHLVKVAAKSGADSKEQPVLFEASMPRMHQIPNYETSDKADNVRVFHGREIRQVKDAAGGMGMVLQLSLAANSNADPDGWTPQEIAGYDGWKHDVGRVWRNGQRLQEEGFVDFPKKFGKDAFTLNHRFYLHLDRSGAMWLAAEDGCEGTPTAQGRSSMFSPLTKMLGL